MQPEPSLGSQAISVKAKDSFYLLVPVKKTLFELELRDQGKTISASAADKLVTLAKQLGPKQ